MSVLEYLENFAVLSPYPTWTDIYTSDFQTVYKNTDNAFDALTITSKTTPSELFTFLAMKAHINESNQHITYVNTLTTASPNYYGSSQDGLTNIKNDIVPLSVSWKSVNSNKILTLKLTWKEQHTYTNKDHHILDLPEMPLIHDLLVTAIKPSPGAIILKHHERALTTLIAACTTKQNQADAYLTNFKTKSLTKLMEYAECFDSKINYSQNFSQITNHFFKSISEHQPKQTHKSRSEHDTIHLHLETMEKVWTLSLYYIITSLCPIPCALAYFTKSHPINIWTKLKTYLEELISPTDQTPDKRLLNKAYDLRNLTTMSISELYFKTLNLYTTLFEESVYQKEKINERLEALLKAKYLRKNRNTEPFLQKDKIPSDKTKIRQASTYTDFCQLCESIPGKDNDFTLFTLAFTEPKLIQKIQRNKPHFFHRDQFTKLRFVFSTELKTQPCQNPNIVSLE